MFSSLKNLRMNLVGFFDFFVGFFVEKKKSETFFFFILFTFCIPPFLLSLLHFKNGKGGEKRKRKGLLGGEMEFVKKRMGQGDFVFRIVWVVVLGGYEPCS